jgi:hypothetical protein
MKPIEVGFDGSFSIWSSGLGKKLDIKLARSDKPPEYFENSPNFNFLLPNTFMWYMKDEPELLYRAKNGKLYSMNFKPFGEKE